MSPRSVLGRENVPRVAEAVKRLLKADCTDFTKFQVNWLSLTYFSGLWASEPHPVANRVKLII